VTIIFALSFIENKFFHSLYGKFQKSGFFQAKVATVYVVVALLLLPVIPCELKVAHFCGCILRKLILHWL
jgi:hypothetical protein